MRYHSITALMHQTLKLETDSTVEIQVLLKPKIFFESVSQNIINDYWIKSFGRNDRYRRDGTRYSEILVKDLEKDTLLESVFPCHCLAHNLF